MMTPDREPQTERKFNETQYTMHSGVEACCEPQLKALGVLERLVEQIGPQSRASPRHPSHGKREVERPEFEGLTHYNN